MEFGYTRRENAKDAMRARAPESAATLGSGFGVAGDQQGVSQARSVRAPQVIGSEYSARILDQVAKFGDYSVKQAAEAEYRSKMLEGQFAHQQGKTFEEMETEGDKWALAGWQSMEAQAVTSEMLAAQIAEIEQGGYEMSQDEMRAQWTRRIKASMEGQSPQVQEQIMEMASRSIGPLVEKHTAMHVGWQEQKAFDALSTAVVSMGGDSTAQVDLIDLMNGRGAAAGLSGERRQGAVVTGIIAGLQQDKPGAYATALSTGYLDSLPPEVYGQVYTANKAYKARMKGKANAEYLKRQDEIITRAENGEYAGDDYAAVNDLIKLDEEYGYETSQAEAGALVAAAKDGSIQVGIDQDIEMRMAAKSGDWDTVAEMSTPVIRQIESGGNMHAVSEAGAKSDMQVMDGTNSDPGFGVTPARDNSLAERSRVGRDYWAAMVKGNQNSDQQHWEAGDLEAAAIAYNAGPGVANAWIAAGRDDSMLPEETKNYKAKFAAGLSNRALPTPQMRSEALRKEYQSMIDSEEWAAQEQFRLHDEHLSNLIKSGSISFDDAQEQSELMREKLGIAKSADTISRTIKRFDDAMAAANQLSEDKKTLFFADVADMQSGFSIQYAETKKRVDEGRADKNELVKLGTNFQEAVERRLGDYGLILQPTDEAKLRTSFRETVDKALASARNAAHDDAVIRRAIDTKSFDKLSTAQKERAYQMNETNIRRIANEQATSGQPQYVQEGLADYLANQRIDWMVSNGYVPEEIKAGLQGSLKDELLDKNGAPTPEAMRAMSTYFAVREKSPSVANQMAGDGIAAVRAGLIWQQAGGFEGNLPVALRTVARGSEALNGRNPAEMVKSSDFQNAIKKGIDTIMDRPFRTFMGMRILNDPEATRAENRNIESQENKDTLTTAITAETQRQLMIMPYADPDLVTQAATAEVMRKTEIVNGQVIAPLKAGQPGIREQMFGAQADEFDSDTAVEEALQLYIEEYIADNPGYRTVDNASAASMAAPTHSNRLIKERGYTDVQWTMTPTGLLAWLPQPEPGIIRGALEGIGMMSPAPTLPAIEIDMRKAGDLYKRKVRADALKQ